MDTRFIRVLALPKGDIFGASFFDVVFSGNPSLTQGCHVDDEASKILADEVYKSLWTINITFVLENAVVPDPKGES